MTLVECRHRICFDCMAKKITNADTVKELPRCPVPRCANPMTKSEVSRVAEKVHSANLACSRVMATAQLSEATDEERTTVRTCLSLVATFNLHLAKRRDTRVLLCLQFGYCYH